MSFLQDWLVSVACESTATGDNSRVNENGQLGGEKRKCGMVIK